MLLSRQLWSRRKQFERDVEMNPDLSLLLGNEVLEDDTNVVYHRSHSDLNESRWMEKQRTINLTLEINRDLSKEIIGFESIIIPNSKF